MFPNGLSTHFIWFAQIKIIPFSIKINVFENVCAHSTTADHFDCRVKDLHTRHFGATNQNSSNNNDIRLRTTIPRVKLHCNADIIILYIFSQLLSKRKTLLVFSFMGSRKIAEFICAFIRSTQRTVATNVASLFSTVILVFESIGENQRAFKVLVGQSRCFWPHQSKMKLSLNTHKKKRNHYEHDSRQSTIAISMYMASHGV